MEQTIQREKLGQAIGLLRKQDIDCWLTFVRETSEQPDPVLKLTVGHEVTWQSAFLVTQEGHRVALVGRYDAELVRAAGLYPTLRTYDADIGPVLLETIQELRPRQIAINYSLGDVAADGLTHGMYLQLVDALKGTPYAERLISSASIVSSLRARKTPAELERMHQAIGITNEIYAQVNTFIKPGVTERAIADLMHAEVQRRGLGTSWDWDHCPTVQTGPLAAVGHGGPSDRVVEPGHLVHIDFGVRHRGYCSDMQRMWYVRRPGETTVPPAVQKAWDACVGAIEAGKKVLRPGVEGWKVDEAARQYLVAAGYPEYQHALGHSVGQACHDGGPLLGPRWPRYGETPERIIEADEVFTLELGTMTECGYIGLEDEVMVTPEGCEFISPFQRDIWYIG
jgi:Xaa-Pro aminopeptidase